MTLKDYLFYQDDWVTIYCGNCLEVIPLLEGDFTLLTDPPYFNLDLAWMSKMNVEHKKNPNLCDNVIERDPEMDFSFLFKYPKRLVWGFPYIYDPLATGWIVWDKQPKINWRGIGTPVEIASTTLRNGFDLIHCMWAGYMHDFDKGEKRYEHPTQKPLKVIKGCIEQFCDEGDVIFDPFLGSGTACVAAKMLDHKSIGIEMNPDYCKISAERVRAVYQGVNPKAILKGEQVEKKGLIF
jgi:hypothetical protein